MRHKAIRPAQASFPPAQPIESGVLPEGAAATAVPALLSNDQSGAGRLAMLRQCRLKNTGSALHESVVEAAALVWARTPPRSTEGDRRATSILAGMLFDDAEVYGSVDVRRALRRASVDRWLTRTGTQRSVSSARTYRTTIYTAGRALYPREYPALQEVSAPRTKGRPAADPQQVRDAYAVVPLLPPASGRRLALILDACGGAGLHSDELKALHGTAIRPLPMDDRMAAVITVNSGTSVTREVPVVAPGRARRLLAAAAEVGPRPLLGLGRRDSVGKNVVNAPMAVLRNHGVAGICPESLRNRWILDLSERVPAVVLLQLAGVSDLRVLSDQRNQLVVTKTVEMARILMEAML